jgi:GT2 family glycosyltransferase
MLMAKVIAFTQRNPRSPSSRGAGDGNRPRSSSVISIATRSARTDTAAGSNILISIVVVTCERPHLLSHCLASLLWQRFDMSRYEIIVVDDRPSSCTRDIVTDWAMHAKRSGPKVIYIPSDGPHGIAAARNRGWRAASGAVIAFTNDDTVARADWLLNGWNGFEHDVQAVWGRVVVPYANSSGGYERHMKNMEHGEFTSVNCFCRKQVLENLGGFDERFDLAWREDADLYFRLLSRSDRVVHAPSAVMTRPIRAASWGESLRQQKRIQADALLYKKHPELYRQKIRTSRHWECYLIVAALLGFLAALALHQFVVASAAGATWLFLTGWFGVHRLATAPMTVSHIAETIASAVLAPPLALFWRLSGAVKFRVPFF